MALDPTSLPVEQAWEPLPPDKWNSDNARHLLHRIGFSATPDRVEIAVKDGMDVTLGKAFDRLHYFPKPAAFAAYDTERDQLQAQIRQFNGSNDPVLLQQRQQLVMEVNQAQRQAEVRLTQEWLTFARDPENSAQENLVMFLSNVLVVGSPKVRDVERLYNHQALLRANWQRPYYDICNEVTFSPAMIEYLDLNTNQRGVPNENYARELMELFTLGVGNYTEHDVKEAARALTGIVVADEQGVVAPNRFDSGQKTIFGRTGPWDSSGVINLIFAQPAARTHLPRRFLTYYLSDDPLPAPYMTALGEIWREKNWRVDNLAKTVFASRLFYEPQFQGSMIKSPIQFYLGLCQDLDLDVTPFDGQLIQSLRSMGQEPYNPPNVRGWLGGKNWINSSTLAARRQTVQQIFAPINEKALNADQLAKLEEARKAGHRIVSISPERIAAAANHDSATVANNFLDYFLAGEPNAAYREKMIDYLDNTVGPRPALVREVAVSLMQSSAYNLC